MDRVLYVLILEDEQAAAERLISHLHWGGFDVSWSRVDSRRSFFNALTEREWDLVLCDHDLSQFTVAEALGLIKESGRESPLIVISEAISPDVEKAASLLKSGVSNFVLPDDPARLLAIVDHTLKEQESRLKQSEKSAEIQRLASFDALTDLPNRTLFFDRLSQALKRSRRVGDKAVVQFIDLDRFKEVNDSLGHAAGDCLLKEAALRLQACLRESDTAARLGGDEFAILLPGTEDAETAEIVAEKIIEAFAEPFVIKGQSFPVTASVGIAVFPGDGEDAETLLDNADTAMYQAKRFGRNRFKRYTEGAVKDEMLANTTISDTEPADTGSGQNRGTVVRLNLFRPLKDKLAVGLAAAIIGIALGLSLSTVLTPENGSQIAIEEDMESLPNMAPAAGGD